MSYKLSQFSSNKTQDLRENLIIGLTSFKFAPGVSTTTLTVRPMAEKSHFHIFKSSLKNWHKQAAHQINDYNQGKRQIGKDQIILFRDPKTKECQNNQMKKIRFASLEQNKIQIVTEKIVRQVVQNIHHKEYKNRSNSERRMFLSSNQFQIKKSKVNNSNRLYEKVPNELIAKKLETETKHNKKSLRYDFSKQYLTKRKQFMSPLKSAQIIKKSQKIQGWSRQMDSQQCPQY